MFFDFLEEEEDEIDPEALKIAKEKTVVKDLNDLKPEVWEVLQLKTDLEPFSKPSPIIDKLKEIRKQRHEFLLSKLAKNLNDVNVETENDIRVSSEEIKAHMDLNREKLDEILNGINVPEVASYHGSVFCNIQLQVNQMKIKQQNLIEEFYEDLISYEKIRFCKNEKIFHSSAEEIRKNGHILPYELQSFIEQETLKMNQLVLNNRRCYEDLRLKLTLNTEETYKSFTDKMFCIQEKWIRQKTLEACQHMLDETEIKATEIIPELYRRLELKGNELVTDLTPDRFYNTCEVKDWLSNVNSVVSKIEKYGVNLIDKYRKMLDAVFLNFSSEVEDIKKELSMMENLEIEERIIKPIAFETQYEQICNVEELETYWQESLSQIRSIINDVVQFLFDVGKVWDKHDDRISESKKLILAAWEKKNENNRMELQDTEVKLNMGLDALRQEYEKNKMDKLFENVTEILDEIKSKLENNYLGEVSVIEEFYEMVNLEADVLSSEIKELIYTTHPLPPYEERDSIDEENICERKYVHMQIKLCAAHIKKVTSWKKGVWKALEGFSQNTRDGLVKRAEPWVKMKIREMSEKMEIQMEIHHRRYERIKIVMHETRLKEIDEHQLIFDRHKTKIEEIYKEVKHELQTLKRKELIKLNELNEVFAAAEEKMKTENRSGVIESFKIQMEKRKTDREEKVQMTCSGLLRDCEALISSIREKNINFMKSMRLFSEGGDYHADELKSYMGHLEMIDKNATIEMKDIEKECSKIQSDLLKSINDSVNAYNERTSCISDELQFYDEVSAKMAKYIKIIQDIALHFKSDFNLLKNQCEELTETIKHLNPDLTIYQDRLLFSIIKTLYKNTSNIFYPLNLPEGFEEIDENVSEDETFGLSDITGRATRAPSEGAPKTESFTCKDYKPELFKMKNPPDNDFTFMAVISNKLWSFMDDLQYLGCIFYRKMKDQVIVRNDLLWPDYDKFAEDILIKFQCYNLQCEQLWLRIMQEFLALLYQLKKAFNKYIEQRISILEKKAVGMIANQHQEFMIKASEHLEETDREMKMLEERLLPLHGHPNNQNLLQQLQDDVICKASKLSADWELAIASYKEELKSFETNYLIDQAEVRKIEVHCLKIRDALFVDSLGCNLLDAISKYIERGGYYVKRNSVKSSNPPPAPPSTPVENPCLEIPSNCDLNLSPLGMRTQEVQMHLLELEDLLWPKDDNSEFYSNDLHRDMPINILIEPVSWIEIVESSLRNIDTVLKELSWVANSQNHIHDEVLFKWLDVWKFNVKKILKLYVVKYPEPEPPPGKS